MVKKFILATGYMISIAISSKVFYDFGTETGYKNGKRDGINIVNKITDYEIMTIESIKGIDSLQNNLR